MDLKKTYQNILERKLCLYLNVYDFIYQNKINTVIYKSVMNLTFDLQILLPLFFSDVIYSTILIPFLI